MVNDDLENLKALRNFDDGGAIPTEWAANKIEELQAEVSRLKRATLTVRLNANAIIARAKRDFGGVNYERDAHAIIAAIKEWNGEW
jgi:uncharacterized protein HemX